MPRAVISSKGEGRINSLKPNIIPSAIASRVAIYKQIDRARVRREVTEGVRPLIRMIHNKREERRSEIKIVLSILGGVGDTLPGRV